MESRSYKFGDLKKKLQESTNEFKGKFGDGVQSQNTKTINRKAYNDIEKETKDYNNGAASPKAINAGQSQLAQVNMGMSDWQYDGEIGEEFKNNAQSGLEGYTSALDKKNHSKEALGNASRDDKIAKAAEKTAKDVKSMQDAQSEVGLTNAQKPKDATHLHTTNIGESKKVSLLKFKHVQFISESHMLSHVPDEYKNEGKKFYMQDCKGNKYLVEWHDKPEVNKMLNEEKTKSEMDRIKYLFGYNGTNTNTTNSIRMNEDKSIDDMLGRVRSLVSYPRIKYVGM